jgi:TorA maturation chaperone TorD
MTEEKKKVPFARTAYDNAERLLRAAHPEEFEALLQAEYDREGVKRIKRLTPEERAAKVAQEKAAKEAVKAAAAREKALAAAQALALEYPDLVQVTAPSLDEIEETLASA